MRRCFPCLALSLCLLVLGAPWGAAAPGDAEKLIERVFGQDLPGLERLIGAGIDVNARDSGSGSTALILACSYGFRDMAELLLSGGANPDIQDAMGNTALMAAVQVSREMAELLLCHGADPGIRARDGLTAFTHSIVGVLSGSVALEVPAMLLDRGADVDEAASSGPTAGYTALMMAALNNRRELVHFLIDRGADVNAAAGDGATALALAAKERHRDVIALLEESGARR
jgi:ankyrin repeat protein